MEAEAQAKAPVTAMDSGLYRKNVMKTLSVKPAKLGLALAARNTEYTNIMHCVHGFETEVGEFFKAMRPYLLGEQIGKIDKFGPDGPQVELGDAGYYLQAGAKVLKLKPVSAKKKIKLAAGATLTSRILDFLDIANQMSDLMKKTYYGPPMKEEEKAVRNPATKEVTMKMVKVVDKHAWKVKLDERKDMLKVLWPQAMELHAELCLAILGTPTGPVNQANIKKLALRFGDGVFELEKAEAKDPVKEAVAAQAPAQEPATV